MKLDVASQTGLTFLRRYGPKIAINQASVTIGLSDYLTVCAQLPSITSLTSDIGRTQTKADTEMLKVYRSDQYGASPSRSIQDISQRMAGQVGSGTVILLTGERGVGTDFAARVIHAASARRERSFIKVDCATPLGPLETRLFGREKDAMAGGRWLLSGLEYANSGILFLDELHALPSGLASRLVDVLRFGRVSRSGGQQSLAVDVAVLAAKKPAMNDEFWTEFSRLKVIEARLAPLRERKDEIPGLASSFLGDFNRRYQRTVELPSRTMSLFMEYAWPENVRELRNVIRRLVVTGNAGQVHRGIVSAIENGRGTTPWPSGGAVDTSRR